MPRTTLPALVAQLLQDGLGVARAEVQLQKTKITTRIAAAKTGAILFAAAGTIALLASIGFVVGETIALAALVGPALAGLIVLLIGLAIAGLLGWLGMRALATPPQAVAETLP